MDARQFLLVILGIIIVGIAIATGLALFDAQANQEAAEKAKQAQVQAAPPQPANTRGYIQGSTLGIYKTGTVIRFAHPEIAPEVTLAEMKQYDYWVHIKDDMGQIHIIKIPYETWMNLEVGDRIQ